LHCGCHERAYVDVTGNISLTKDLTAASRNYVLNARKPNAYQPEFTLND
jgi:hypothetical protein